MVVAPAAGRVAAAAQPHPADAAVLGPRPIRGPPDAAATAAVNQYRPDKARWLILPVFTMQDGVLHLARRWPTAASATATTTRARFMPWRYASMRIPRDAP